MPLPERNINNYFNCISLYSHCIQVSEKSGHYTKALYVPCVTTLPPLEITQSKLCKLHTPFFCLDQLKKKISKMRWNSHLWGIHSHYFCYCCFSCTPQGICMHAHKHTHTHSLTHAIIYTLPREFYPCPLPAFRLTCLAGGVCLLEYIENAVICNKIYLL